MKQTRHSTVLTVVLWTLGALFALGSIPEFFMGFGEKSAMLGTAIVTAGLGFGFMAGAYALGKPRTFPNMACSHCGIVAPPLDALRGSTGIEFLLYFLMVLPGLIYSIWRYGGDRAHCPGCGQGGLVPLASPRGRELSAAAQRSNEEQLAKVP